MFGPCSQVLHDIEQALNIAFIRWAALRQSWALSATIRQIDIEFVDRHCRLSVVGEQEKTVLSACRCRSQVWNKYSCIIAEKLSRLCRPVVVWFKFLTDKVALSLKKCSGVVGLSLSGSILWPIQLNYRWKSCMALPSLSHMTALNKRKWYVSFDM